MKNLTKLYELLDFEYNSDYWYDQMRGEIGTKTENLNENEIINLSSDCLKLSCSAQINLAEANLFVEKNKAFKILLQLVKSPFSSVGSANSLLELGYSWDSKSSILDDLTRHLKNAESREIYSIEFLIKRLAK